jgi:hypothetical protein
MSIDWKSLTPEEREAKKARWDEHNNELTFVFDSYEDAALFKAWMSDGGGEQSLNYDGLEDDEGNPIYYELDYWDGANIRVEKKERTW